jgi:hypothetical protein
VVVEWSIREVGGATVSHLLHRDHLEPRSVRPSLDVNSGVLSSVAAIVSP